MQREKIKEQLVQAYDQEELCDIAHAVVYRNIAEYKHLLNSYLINSDELEEIFIEMNYIGS